MKNYSQPGEDVDVVTPSGGMTAGLAYLIGVMFGFANLKTAAGAPNVLSRKGIYKTVPKATGAAWAQGALLYWDDTAKNFTTTAGSNKKVGAAAVAALSGDATGDVLLIPSI